MKPAMCVLHMGGPGEVLTNTVQSKDCKHLPLCHVYFTLEMRMEIAHMSSNKMKNGSWSAVMN